MVESASRFDPRQPGRRVAVIGAGAAGLAAAWRLQRHHRVTIFEAGPTAGGHVHTVEVPHGPDAGTAVDMGFIVYNERNYPTFRRILEELEVESQPSDMSFGYECEASGLQYAGTGLNGLFAQRANLARPPYWRLVAGILRFGRLGRAAVAGEGIALDGITLGDFLDQGEIDEATVRHFVLPMGAAIWSGSRREIRAFPAAVFLRFFHNHGLLGLGDRPAWRTIRGGSRRWVERLLGRFDGTVRLGHPVAQLGRAAAGIVVRDAAGHGERFDAAVVATHADQALALLEQPTEDERRILGAWRYSRNLAWLHTDASAMPSNPRAWASWNYVRGVAADDRSPVRVTYDMNRLQRLSTRARYLVTLNPEGIRQDAVLEEVPFTHPIYDFTSLRAQEELPSLNGVDRVWYCGAHFRHGFHEDAVRSGVLAAEDFEVRR